MYSDRTQPGRFSDPSPGWWMAGCGFGMLITIIIVSSADAGLPGDFFLGLVALSLMLFGVWYARARHRAAESHRTD